MACLNNDMFRPLYRSSSGCTVSYFKANYTIYSVFCFVNAISCTSKVLLVEINMCIATVQFAFQVFVFMDGAATGLYNSRWQKQETLYVV